jgi:hypothetical protein
MQRNGSGVQLGVLRKRNSHTRKPAHLHANRQIGRPHKPRADFFAVRRTGHFNPLASVALGWRIAAILATSVDVLKHRVINFAFKRGINGLEITWRCQPVQEPSTVSMWALAGLASACLYREQCALRTRQVARQLRLLWRGRDAPIQGLARDARTGLQACQDASMGLPGMSQEELGRVPRYARMGLEGPSDGLNLRGYCGCHEPAATPKATRLERNQTVQFPAA